MKKSAWHLHGGAQIRCNSVNDDHAHRGIDLALRTSGPERAGDCEARGRSLRQDNLERRGCARGRGQDQRRALDAHKDAIKRLSTGKGNALTIGERIRSLGVKTKRPTPAVQVEGIPIAIAADGLEETNETAPEPNAANITNIN